MAYKALIEAPAQRDLDRLPGRVLPAVVEFVFGALADNPRRVGKPLRFELTGLFSARRGPYRILYGIDEAASVVNVIRIEFRANVYRQL